MLKIQKLKLQNIDNTAENIEIIGKLFPQVITEKEDENGKIIKAIDFDLLKQVLSKDLVEDNNERYQLNRPGKKASILKANTPINKTLRPAPDESVNFDNTENLYIEGDNFEVLKILQESYLGKVKMIYIDPPYNTGQDFVYKDNFKKSKDDYEDDLGVEDEEGGKLFKNTDTNGRFHSDWLSMMYERLVVARDLLKDDGVIFMSIDDNEVHNLRKIADEIFGEENCAGVITILKGNAQNDAENIQVNHEYVLCYIKNNIKIRNIKSEKILVFKDQKGYYYKGSGITTGGEGGTLKSRPNLGWTLYYNPTTGDKIIKNDYNKELINTSNDEEIIYENDNILLQKGYRIIRAPKKGNELGCWTWQFSKAKDELYNLGITDSFNIYKKEYINEKYVIKENDKLYFIKNKEFPIKSFIEIKSGTGTTNLKELFNKGKVFDYSKNEKMIFELISRVEMNKNDIILDFFSGSATTAHAVMQLNAEDDGNRKFIMVQIPEATDEKSEAYKAGYKNICEIGKERIRRAGKKILEEMKGQDLSASSRGQESVISTETKGSGEISKQDPSTSLEMTQEEKSLDIGFRVYKVDSSNIKDVYFHPNDIDQKKLSLLESNIKEDRKALDLLTEIMLDLGLTLDLSIESKTIAGNTVYFVAGNSLVACFDEFIDFAIVDEIAKYEPLKVVFRDSSFKNDSDKINFETRFKKLSPETVIRVI